MADYDTQRKRYEAAGQGHVFHYYDQLDDAGKKQLVASAVETDIERATRVFKISTSQENGSAHPPPTSNGHANGNGHAHPTELIHPPTEDAFDSTLGDEQAPLVREWRRVGLEAIAANKVAVLLMAGGQGTRLGSSDPKGCYDIGLPSHKPLFQIQAERIIRLQSVAELEYNKSQGSVVIPWYVMTSGPTRSATEAFFEKHEFFGLDRKNVIFFEQGTMPCFTLDGKVILGSPSEISTAPDGNGGVYAGMRRPLSPSNPSHTVLSDLRSRNISYIHAHAVDNCLVRVADPIFVGFSISKQADCSSKVVPKLHATESVGVVAMKGDVFAVIEYSEITKEQAERRDPHRPDQLAFRAANIVNHFYTTEFLESVENFEAKMPFHIAKKKIPFVDFSTAEGTVVKPSSPNGIKLEQFVFDVFPFAKRMVVLEVDRKEEFSVLKNAPNTGSDDPQTSRQDLLAQQRRFIEGAGAKVSGEDVEIEVSPLVTYAGEGLEGIKGKTFSRSGYVDAIESFDALV